MHNPIVYLCSFSTMVWNFKAKFYTFMQSS